MALSHETTRATASPVLLPAVAVVGGIVSLSIGTSFAEHLFPIVGAQGTTALRVTFAAVLLTIIWRPWRRRLTRREAVAVGVYGAILGVMNLAFYLALRTIPFGIAVAIEFMGPLSIAALSSRRPMDFVWIGFAVLGLSQLLPFGGASRHLDPVGLAFAGAAGVAWAGYIIFGERAGRLRGADSVALGTAVATLVVLPFGVLQAGGALLAPGVLAMGLGVALLSSAVPYTLEMYAMQRLPRQTFGVLLSVEPAISALAGLVILNQALSATQWMAIGSIVVASIGSAATAGRRR
ncbi:MAG: EamA family transporter [Janthinobacterium lividum]